MSLSRSDTTVIRLARASTSPAPRQTSASPPRPVQPAPRFLVALGAVGARANLAFVAVAHTYVGKPQNFARACIDRQHRMQQHTAQIAALADRPKALGANLGAPQDDLAGVLDRQNVAPRRPISGALGRRRAQPRNRHGLIAQKAPETNLRAPPAAGNLAHARTRARDKRGVTQGPLFSSRSSPNPPTPYRSTSTALKSIIGSRICPCSESEFVKKLKEKMCASNSRFAGRRRHAEHDG